MSKVSIQGQQASYHDIARRQFFDNGEEIVCRDSFKQVFMDVASGGSDFGLSAIENSLYGSINQVYDLLLKSDCQIIGEVYLRIKHCLIGLNDAEITDISAVYSQREAVAQCEAWIDLNLDEADIHETNDTAGSVELIKGLDQKQNAAIASEEAAKLHDLKVLKSSIETNHQNYTRFIVIAKDKSKNDLANKSSIILTAANKPGSLYEVLGLFKQFDTNIVKLESRPIPGKPWEYMFYLDFERAINDDKAINLLNNLNNSGHRVEVLGSYPSGSIPKS